MCISEALGMERTNETIGTDDDPLVIVENIQQNICPSQCSMHGRCEEGKCLCDEGISFFMKGKVTRVVLNQRSRRDHAGLPN